MRRAIGLLALSMAAVCASGQVTLSMVQGGVATPAGQLYDFNSVALGTVADVVFRLTNTGASAVYLSQLALVGTDLPTPPYTPYFSVVCGQSPNLCGGKPLQQLPILINPTGTLDFTVQFEPFQLGSPSATMTICAAAVCDGNTITTLLTGTGVQGLTTLLNNQPLSPGETIGFGAVPVGSSQKIALMFSNNTTAALTLPIPALAGGAFSLTGSALTGPTVAPGASAELDITFTPTTVGSQQATLTIGLFTYPLAGTGVAAPPPNFPIPTIQLNLPAKASAQQGTLSVTLASASTASGSGTVTLAFQSAVVGVTDDPAVTFADGTRTATFTVAAGASGGQFAAGPTVGFGTGTTAGTLQFTVTLGSNTAQASVAIPVSVVGIDAAVAARDVACDPSLVYCTTTNIQLQINGWDNTRSTSELVFSFFNASGQAIAPGNITVSTGSAFQQYYAGSDMAGVFGVSALFPVTGDSNQVVSAIVQIVNSAGTVQSATITF
jgi:hypothetical protein